MWLAQSLSVEKTTGYSLDLRSHRMNNCLFFRPTRVFHSRFPLRLDMPPTPSLPCQILGAIEFIAWAYAHIPKRGAVDKSHGPCLL